MHFRCSLSSIQIQRTLMNSYTESRLQTALPYHYLRMNIITTALSIHSKLLWVHIL